MPIRANHGSVRRGCGFKGTPPQVVQVKVDAGGRATSHRVFASGWATKSGSPEQGFWGGPVFLSSPAACACVHTGMSPKAPHTHGKDVVDKRLGPRNELIRSVQAEAAGAQVDQWTCCRCRTALCLCQTTTPVPSPALLTVGADDDTQGTARLPAHICIYRSHICILHLTAKHVGSRNTLGCHTARCRLIDTLTCIG